MPLLESYRGPRFLGALLALLALVLSAIGFAAFRVQQAELRAEVARHLEGLAHDKANRLSAWRTEATQEAYAIGHDALLGERIARWLKAGAAGDEDHWRIESRFADYLTAFSYDAIVLLDAKGEPRISLGPSFAVGSEERALAVRSARSGETVFSEIHDGAGAEARSRVLDIFAPVLAQTDGGFGPVAAVLLRVSADSDIYPLLTDWPEPRPASAETLLVRREGDSVLFLSESPFRSGMALALRLPAGDLALPAARAVSDVEGVVEGRDYRGTPVVAALRAVPLSSWHVVVKMDRDEAYAPIRKVGFMIAAGLTLAWLVLAASLSLWTGRTETQRSALEARRAEALAALSSLPATLEGKVEALAREVTERAARVADVERAGVWLLDAAGTELRCLDLYEKTPAKHSSGMVLKLEQAADRLAPLQPASMTTTREAVVQVSDRRLGVVSLEHADRAHRWDAGEIAFANALAERIALALSNRERNEAEESQRRSEQRFRALIENATDLVVVLTADGTITYVSPSVHRIGGYDAAEVAGRNFLELAHPEERTAALAALADVLTAPGRVHEAELRFRHKDGHWVALQSVAWNALADPAVGGIVINARDITERKRAEARARESAARLTGSLKDTIRAMARSVEKRDPLTAGHQQRVASLAVAIGAELGLAEEQVEGLRFGASIHDIGIGAVPTETLNRPGKLDRLEYELVKTHVRAGHDIMRDIDFPWPVAQIVLQHHERLDGSGYPQGLKGGELSPEARVVAVADVVEAMCSHRPWRAALGVDAALAEIESKRGTAFDPAVVDACLRVFRERGFAFASR